MGMRSDSGVDAAVRFKEWLATRYHLPQDDSDQPMDLLEAGARNAQLEFLVGLEIANADELPTWKQGDFFGHVRAAARWLSLKPSPNAKRDPTGADRRRRTRPTGTLTTDEWGRRLLPQAGHGPGGVGCRNWVAASPGVPPGPLSRTGIIG